MTEEAHKLSTDSTFDLPMTADEALRAIEKSQAVNPLPGFSRTGLQINGDVAMEWECAVGGEMVAGAAPVAVAMLATDDEPWGCKVTITLTVELASVPVQARKMIAGNIDSLAKFFIQHWSQVLPKLARDDASVENQTFDFTAALEVRVTGTVEELIEAITEMLNQSSGTGHTRSGDTLSVELPFEWDCEYGDATRSGVSPATLAVTVGQGGDEAILNVKYTVSLGNAPDEGRDFIRKSLMATVDESGRMWQQSTAEIIANELR
jgi:hypothetical protein